VAITASAKPRKQRKALYTMPHHLRHKLLSAPLSRELREKYGLRSLPVRTGDRVRVMRGDYKGIEGRVIRVNRERGRVYIDTITRTKVDGSTVHVPIHASKVMIVELDLSDKWRKEAIERKRKVREETLARLRARKEARMAGAEAEEEGGEGSGEEGS